MNMNSCKVIGISKEKCAISPVNNNWKQLVVSERIEIPTSMPDIKSIVSIKTNLKIISSNFILTPDSVNVPNLEGTYLTGLKLVVNGEINEGITYEGNGSYDLFFFSHKEPFTAFIVMDAEHNIQETVCLKSCVEGLMIKELSCREILKNVAIFLYVGE